MTTLLDHVERQKAITLPHHMVRGAHPEGLRGSVVVEQETREVAADVDVHRFVQVYVKLTLILSIPRRRRAVASSLLLLSPTDSRSIRNSPRLKGERASLPEEDGKATRGRQGR